MVTALLILALITFTVAAFGPNSWYPRNDRNRMIAVGLALLVLAEVVPLDIL